MNLVGRQFLHLAAGSIALTVISAALVTLMGHEAATQARTIKIVVPFPAGGPTDTLARLLSDQISRAQRATMAVENRPGASSVIGTEAASRAAPDGNTLLINSPAFLINPHIQKLDYDPLTSFETICYLVNSPTVIAVSGSSSFRTLVDLLGAASAKPGELTLASIGPGSTTQIAFEMLKRAAKVDMTFVPYPGMAPAASALLGDQVSSAWLDYAQAGEQIKAGKLRALAKGAIIEALPDVPTVAELGYKDIDADPWFGVLAPAKTPKETVSQLAGWFTTALQDPAVRAKLGALGFDPVVMCGADFGTFMHKQYDQYGRVIREANIKAE
jgi:tripartite-type tricarboxylate transporter receptor subunit TctC